MGRHPGTRNHFAFDIGIDRRDVVGGLDAFFDADERRIDVARVNGRMFLNNAAMGVYGAIVDSAEYRDHKVLTSIAKLTERLGPGAEPFDLASSTVTVVGTMSLISFWCRTTGSAAEPRPRRGTRGGLDQGVLGVIAVARTVLGGITDWTTSAFRVESSTTVAVGIDGESVHVEPPLVFESVPLALRIRTPPRRGPGVSRRATRGTPREARSAVVKGGPSVV